jgi:hypothetical protein
MDIVKPRLTELGKIKIGGKGEERKTKDGRTWRLPEKYDHFVVTTLNRDARGDLIQDVRLMEALKAEGHADKDGHLRSLPIAVLSNDLEDIMQASYVGYVGKRVAARSDGKVLVKYYDYNTSVWLDKPQTVPWDQRYAELVHKKARVFKQHVTFNCVIAATESRWGGVYKFRSTSQISAEQLLGSLIEIRQLTGGILRGLPLRLAIRRLDIQPKELNGQTSTIYVVHCELIGTDLLTIQQQAMERMKVEMANAKMVEQARLEYRQLLAPPGEHEDEEEQAEVAQEFHPGPQNGDVVADDGEILSEAAAPPSPPAEGMVDIRPKTGRRVLVDGVPHIQSGAAWINEEKPEYQASEASMERWHAQGRVKEIQLPDAEEVERDNLAAEIAQRIKVCIDLPALNQVAADMMNQREWLGQQRYDQLREPWLARRRQLEHNPLPPHRQTQPAHRDRDPGEEG